MPAGRPLFIRWISVHGLIRWVRISTPATIADMGGQTKYVGELAEPWARHR